MTIPFQHALLITLVLASACSKQTQDVSLIAVLGAPSRFDGDCVRIVGFVSLEFEGTAIYVHEEDYRQGLTLNALWLEMSRGSQAGLTKGFQGYALIEGRVDSHNRGHMEIFPAAIRDIVRLEEWPFANRSSTPNQSRQATPNENLRFNYEP